MFLASLVAMTIGATMREAEWSSLDPQSGRLEILRSPVVAVGGGPSESIMSAYLLFIVGGVIGALLAGPAWKCCGNRLGMAIFDAVLVSGLIAVTCPVGPTSLIVLIGRLFLGIGSGALTAIVPIHVAEISNPKIRGTYLL